MTKNKDPNARGGRPSSNGRALKDAPPAVRDILERASARKDAELARAYVPPTKGPTPVQTPAEPSTALTERPVDPPRRMLIGRVLEDETLQADLLELAKHGAPLSIMAQAAGVSPRTWTYWLRFARDGKEPYASFFSALHAQRARAAMEIVSEIRAASKGGPDKDGIWRNQWQAGRWLLETGWGRAFAGPPAEVEVRHEHTDGGIAGRVDMSKLSDNEFQALRALLVKAAQTPPEVLDVAFASSEPDGEG